MTALNIIQNLLFSVLVSSLIGFNRESKSSPAGLRTYNLVCLGAVIITMVSKELSSVAAKEVLANPNLKGVLSVDSSKIIAQIVSGIGFLGAGTIIVTQKKIKGLSTASSLWVTAAIGIAVGLEYYMLAILSSVLVVIILATFNKITPIQTLKKISITISDPSSESELSNYFKENGIDVKRIDTKIFMKDNQKFINDTYTIKQRNGSDMHAHILNLSKLPDVFEIEMIDV